MTAALRRLGFDGVFDTNFAADLTIMKRHRVAHAAQACPVRFKKGGGNGHKDDHHTPGPLPMFTSCSPGWIKFLEHYYPDMTANLSTCKSPQQMFGAVAKTYYAQKIGKKPEDIFVASVMPCTAKKYECQRPEMNDSGVQDVDAVLTTRELARMIKQAGIRFEQLPDEKMDAPLGISTGAADIFANTGGVMEAALRTAWEIVTGKPLPFENLHVQPIAGLEGVKEASAKITGAKPEWSFLEGAELKVAVAHGLGNARKVIEAVRSGQKQYHFIEVMTCPGGCIGGGGQPRLTTNDHRLARIRAIYEEDEHRELRKSHENPAVLQLYKEFLGQPLGEKSHKLLHTKYVARIRFKKRFPLDPSPKRQRGRRINGEQTSEAPANLQIGRRLALLRPASRCRGKPDKNRNQRSQSCALSARPQKWRIATFFRKFLWGPADRTFERAGCYQAAADGAAGGLPALIRNHHGGA